MILSVSILAGILAVVTTPGLIALAMEDRRNARMQKGA